MTLTDMRPTAPSRETLTQAVRVARARYDRSIYILHLTPEYQAMAEARERLKSARNRLLDCDRGVADEPRVSVLSSQYPWGGAA